MNETTVVTTNEETLQEAVGQVVSKGKDLKGIAIGVVGTVGAYFAVKLICKGGKKLLANKNWITLPQQQEAQKVEEPEVEQPKAEPKNKK